MNKRRRGATGPIARARPIDKVLTFISLGNITSTQQITTIFTCTTACTIVGLRWAFFAEGDLGTTGQFHDLIWAFVVVRDGENVTALNRTNEAKFYAPEQNCMAFGIQTSRASISSSTGIQTPTVTDKCKTMRKLLVGDKLVFVTKGNSTDTSRVEGITQLFCKT